MGEANTIFKVWGEHTGWVRMPRKLRNPASPKGPKNHEGKWEEKMFKWPDQSTEIVDWIKDSNANKYDLYWSPCIFAGPRGIKDNVTSMGCLYADLDEVDPAKIPLKYRPSMCVESSPGRYAGIWMLDSDIPASDFEKLNKRLTYYIGADKGGWDLTQVLRIPGMRNYKYDGAPKSKLLWFNEQPYASTSFDSLPDIDLPDIDPIPQEDMLDSDIKSLPELVRPYLSKLSSKTLELLFASDADVLLADRSERLWELECKLLESGIPKADVINLVAACNWNKYKGRKDETRRIVSEVEKAASSIKPQVSEMRDFMEKKWTTYSDLMSQTLDEPGWMIEGFWQRTSHGMIAGEPKTYKSVIATDMAISVASGGPFLGRYRVNHQGPVMYINEENAPWLVKDRLEKMATSKNLINGSASMKGSILTVQFPQDLPLYFLNNRGFDFTSDSDRAFLEESIKEVQPVLIIFDPLYLMLGGKDENSSKDIRPVLNWLLYLRYTYKTSIIVVHHWNKSGKSDRGGQRMLGSVLFHGWVESALYTSVVDEAKHTIAIDREFRSFTKPPKVDVTFKFGEPGECTYEPQMGDHVDDSEDAVLSLLSNYRLTETEIVEQLGAPRKHVQSRLKDLLKSKRIAKDGELYYAVADED